MSVLIVSVKKNLLFISAIVMLLAGLVLPSTAATIIQYHHVSNEAPYATTIRPALFVEHMAYLHANNYRVVALEELVTGLKNKKIPDEKTIAITFDDGYRSVYEEAFPVLKKYAWPFTVFVNTKPIEENLSQFVSWQELSEMAEYGATIANHSFSHPHMLRYQNDETEQQWQQRITTEILKAEQQITKHTGQAHRLFAHPYGETDSKINALLLNLQFVGFGQQSGPLSLQSNLAALPRFPFGGAYGEMEDFKVKVNSLPMPVREIRLTTSEGERVDDAVLPLAEKRPILELLFEDVELANRVNCFASGQGAISTVLRGNRVFVQAPQVIPLGRSRYNCTSTSGVAGRFYWYSQLFIRRQEDGDWHPEP